MIEIAGNLINSSHPVILGYFLVFVRVGAVCALLPGFGELFLPARIRLAVALSFSLLCYPLVSAHLPVLKIETLPPYVLSEAVSGLAFGVSLRLMVVVLQVAGSVAAQSTALSQVAGVGITPDPTPAIGNLLTIAGISLAMILDLHLKVISAIAETYSVLPFGMLADAATLATWGVLQASRAFALALSLATPFVLGSFAYNVALGAINRAMPQLMVAFIGAPAITAGTLVLLFLASPVILLIWTGRLDQLLAAPMGISR